MDFAVPILLYSSYEREQLQHRCAFVFDVKQAVRAGFDPYDMCDAMGNLIHVHINDNLHPAGLFAAGNGTMDYPRLLGQLKQQDYQGSFIIEVYRRNFEQLEELNSSAKYLNENYPNILDKQVEVYRFYMI